jgi:hypothetical protein
MLTNLVGVNKANRRTILKALKNKPARGLIAGAQNDADGAALSVKKTIDNWNELLSNARERMASCARTNSQEVGAQTMKHLSDEDWEAALEQTADRPALDMAVAAAVAAAAAKQSSQMAAESVEQNANGDCEHVETTECDFYDPDSEQNSKNSCTDSAVSEAADCQASATDIEPESTSMNEATTPAVEGTSDSPDLFGHKEIEELKNHVKALERELSLTDTKRDILRQQLEMSEQKAEILREQLLQWQQESESVRLQLEESREAYRLQAEQFHVYAAEVEQLKQDNENIAKTVNIAWQQGYLAGRAAAEDEEKQRAIVEQLSSGSGNATRGDTTSTQDAKDQTIFVIADSPVIKDPEVLNDPFTAKLLNALQADGTEIDGLYEEPLTAPRYDDYSDANADQDQTVTSAPAAEAAHVPPPIPNNDLSDDGWTTGSPMTTSFVAGSNGVINASEEKESETHEDHAAEAGPMPPPLPPELPGHGSVKGSTADSPDGKEYDATESEAKDPEAHDPNESSQRFTADELHSLFRNRMEEKKDPPPTTQTQTNNTGTTKKFVGGKHTSPASSGTIPAVRVFPPEIRKACRLLGINPEDVTTRASVTEAWKKEMSKPGVHPDTGGDTEMAIYLNTAKDCLMRWVDDQTPKLGKKFGSAAPKQQKPE